jgi:hypothetical protein
MEGVRCISSTSSGVSVLNLLEITVRPVPWCEEQRFQELMQEHHYLGSLPKIGETLWYVACWKKQWVALLTFSAPAWKCAARERWIGWDFRHQYDRLHLVTNNSRFLILPNYHVRNLASRILSLCHKRLPADWQQAFGHPVLLLETFVDPQYFHGTVYKAANWVHVGASKGFRRTRKGYSTTPRSPKMLFLKPLHTHAQSILSAPIIQPSYRKGGPHIMLSAQHMRSLPYFFRDIPDPRRSQGRRHSLSTVLAIAAGAILCGMRGYTAISDWAQGLSQQARERFGCRRENNRYVVPSLFVIRDALIRVHPLDLDRALQGWNEAHGQKDKSLALDGKTMRNAIDEQGHQVHIVGVVGHETKNSYTQKKWVPFP